jgi:hypothetical protein
MTLTFVVLVAHWKGMIFVAHLFHQDQRQAVQRSQTTFADKARTEDAPSLLHANF